MQDRGPKQTYKQNKVMEKSESIIKISAALAAFRQNMGKISKTSENPFFKSKYAALPEILDAIYTPMQDAGLMYIQFPDGDSLTTILYHLESGEFMQASYNLHPEKSTPQAMGSAITYARRYALGAILGLNIDSDDDGNQASKQAAKKPILAPKTENWKKAIEYLRTAENATIEEIEKKYSLTTGFRELLLSEAI